MNTLSLFTVVIALTTNPFLVDMKPVQYDSSNNAHVIPPNLPGQNFSLSRYTTMLENVVGAAQTIKNLTNRSLDPFEYCFVPSIANPPSANLTIEKRLLIDYRVLNELTVPLRDVLNYERRISNDSDVYQKLSSVWEQVNTSLEQIQNIQKSDQLMEQLSHSGVPRERLTNNSTSNNSTTSQGRCEDVVTNPTDKSRDLFEVFLGLGFAASDLYDIQNELNPN